MAAAHCSSRQTLLPIALCLCFRCNITQLPHPGLAVVDLLLTPPGSAGRDLRPFQVVLRVHEVPQGQPPFNVTSLQDCHDFVSGQ
eukprot:1701284-Amphidinium_carterae.2